MEAIREAPVGTVMAVVLKQPDGVIRLVTPGALDEAAVMLRLGYQLLTTGHMGGA